MPTILLVICGLGQTAAQRLSHKRDRMPSWLCLFVSWPAERVIRSADGTDALPAKKSGVPPPHRGLVRRLLSLSALCCLCRIESAAASTMHGLSRPLAGDAFSQKRDIPEEEEQWSSGGRFPSRWMWMVKVSPTSASRSTRRHCRAARLHVAARPRMQANRPINLVMPRVRHIS